MKIADEYGIAMRVGRIIVNSPSSQGAIGDIYNTNTPSLTLGCGSYGKNSVSQNVTTVNLINKKRIAKRRDVYKRQRYSRKGIQKKAHQRQPCGLPADQTAPGP